MTEYLHRLVGPLDEPLELIAPTRHTARRAMVLLAAAATATAAAAAIIVLPHVASSNSPAVAPIEVQIAEAVVITR